MEGAKGVEIEKCSSLRPPELYICTHVQEVVSFASPTPLHVQSCLRGLIHMHTLAHTRNLRTRALAYLKTVEGLRRCPCSRVHGLDERALGKGGTKNRHVGTRSDHPGEQTELSDRLGQGTQLGVNHMHEDFPNLCFVGRTNQIVIACQI